MTQQELDSIPETGTFGSELRMVGSKTVCVPVLSDVGPLWTEADEPCFVRDVHGQGWHIGRAEDGKRYKRRSNA